MLRKMRLLTALLKTVVLSGGAVIASIRLMLHSALVFFAFPLILFSWIGDDFFAYTQEYLLYTTICLTLCVCASLHFMDIHRESVSALSRLKLARVTIALALGILIYIPFHMLLSIDEDIPMTVWGIVWVSLSGIQIVIRCVKHALRVSMYQFLPKIYGWIQNIRKPISIYVCASHNRDHINFLSNIQADQALHQKKWYTPSRHICGVIVESHKDVGLQVEGTPAITSFESCREWGGAHLTASQSHHIVVTDCQSPSITHILKLAFMCDVRLFKPLSSHTAELKSLTLSDLLTHDTTYHDVGKYYAQKTVLLTYAGSNSSYSLIEQLLKSHVKKLVLLDFDEESFIQIRTKITQNYAHLLSRCVFHVGHITDHGLIEYVIQKEKPHIVLHAPRLCSAFLSHDRIPMDFVRTFVLSTEFLAYTAQHHGVKQCVLLLKHNSHDEQLNFFIPLIKTAFMRYAKTGDTQYFMIQADPCVNTTADIQQTLSTLRTHVLDQSVSPNSSFIHNTLLSQHVPMLSESWAQTVVQALSVFKKSHDLMEYTIRMPSQLRWCDLVMFDAITHDAPNAQKRGNILYPDQDAIVTREKTTKHPAIHALEYTGWLENETLEHILNAADQCDATQLAHMLYTHEAFLKDAA